MLLPPCGRRSQFTSCSLSIIELLLWTLAVSDRFSLCRITKQYLRFIICTRRSIYSFFFLTHCYRTLNWGSTCKEKKVTVNYLLLHSMLWLRLLYFLEIHVCLFLRVTKETCFSKAVIVRYMTFYLLFHIYYFLD